MTIEILTVLPELLESPFAHSIMKRAQELDREDMVPESWDSEEKVLVDDEAKQFLSNLMELEMLEIETGLGEI